MRVPVVALALVAVLAFGANASTLLLKDAALNSVKGYANLKAYLKDATEVTTSLTGASLTGATALVVDAGSAASNVIKMSVGDAAFAGFYSAVTAWVKEDGGNLILADGGAGGWLPVISKIVGKAQNCTGVEFDVPKNTFARRVSKGPFAEIDTWRKVRTTEVPAGLKCSPGNGRTVLSTRPFTNAVSVVHAWAVGRGTIVYFGNTFEGKTVRAQFTDVLDIAIAIPAPKPTPSPEDAPPPVEAPPPMEDAAPPPKKKGNGRH
ncbi:hypothetical protein HXX76_008445 [Chlamydomonas incerta]|uniref:Uncharacterized protein n=1 Tax=Chlamydomonas incerta TaxID=51695 RepID=A0A835T871_CHLIN|nr:hypothetical protein HXX76_008445 [Chlamydomonas incerta]|eukprot:KAG2433385.1 hypothetical protein HXX76_008445 [Chlamydomonas incerta]